MICNIKKHSMYYFKKKHLQLFIITSFLVSCNSVRRYNEKFDAKIAPEKLQKDVTYIHKKLTKLHPQLYYYISKKDLDYKFDSLKNTIQEPLTRKEFYFKISPIIASIRQGHTYVNIPSRRLTKSQNKVINSTNLLTPISDLDVEFFDQKLYIVKNNSADSSIQLGTEIISIDSVKPLTVYDKYYNTFASDGFNTTFKKWKLNNYIITRNYFEKGYKDSMLVVINVKGDTLTKMIKRNVKKKSIQQRVDQRKIESKNCHLSFVGADSNIALLKVDNFKSLSYEKFFRKIDSVKSPKLILDLRGNSGGLLYSSKKLFSYLIDSSYFFYKPFEITSRTSLLHTRRFMQKNILGKFFHVVFLPFTIVRFSIQFIQVKKVDNRYYSYSFLYHSVVKPRKNYNFNNQIYVITDGGSFSATSLLSAVLKGYHLATFVGEETGGDFNGTCAGQMPTFQLPYSKLKVRFGIKYLNTNCSVETLGRGIMPDVEIIPTLEDRINQRDPELEWILNDIKNQNNK